MHRVALLCVIIGAAAVAAVPAPNCESAEDLIKEAEGFRKCEYKDTMGHPTICYGFNLDASGAKEKIEKVGGDFNKVYNGGCLTETQCTELLTPAVQSAEAAAGAIFGRQCSCVQAVLADMTYNLGAAGMSSFHTFISDIKNHEWSAAAADGRGTLWCKQVGNRCSRDMGIIARGCSTVEQ